MTNKLLADLVFIFHTCIVLFMIIIPFSNVPALLILHIVFGVSLLVHWSTNSNVCSLSVIEAHLRGNVHRTETFTHQFIKGIYDISSTEWNGIVWVITIILMLVSINNLYKTDKFKKFLECIKENDANLFVCMQPLFII